MAAAAVQCAVPLLHPSTASYQLHRAGEEKHEASRALFARSVQRRLHLVFSLQPCDRLVFDLAVTNGLCVVSWFSIPRLSSNHARTCGACVSTALFCNNPYPSSHFTKRKK